MPYFLPVSFFIALWPREKSEAANDWIGAINLWPSISLFAGRSLGFNLVTWNRTARTISSNGDYLIWGNGEKYFFMGTFNIVSEALNELKLRKLSPELQHGHINSSENFSWLSTFCARNSFHFSFSFRFS